MNGKNIEGGDLVRRRSSLDRMSNVTRLLTYHYPNHTVAALTRPLLSPAHSAQEVELGGGGGEVTRDTAGQVTTVATYRAVNESLRSFTVP